MTLYHNFFGIDIGKFNFIVSIEGHKSTFEYSNTPEGIAEFIKAHYDILSNSLCVIETTGGYELLLLHVFHQEKLAIHRADTRKAKNFIRSFGSAAKTDILDAKALAAYAKERGASLKLFTPLQEIDTELFQLIQRRIELKKSLVAEKNRLQSPECRFIKNSIQQVISFLEKQIADLSERISILIMNKPELHQKREILKSIAGIGDTIASNLLVLMPELGALDRRQIASLAGLAPRANDSGRFSGYRSTGYGRNGVKSILFMAAMTASRSKSELGEYYKRLISNGKKKMVALVALMRKILVIANARIRDLLKKNLDVA